MNYMLEIAKYGKREQVRSDQKVQFYWFAPEVNENSNKNCGSFNQFAVMWLVEGQTIFGQILFGFLICK